MLKHKGENLLKDVLENVHSEGIRFYHFGDGNVEHKNIICFGAYPRKEIINILKQHHIDVILLLSTWPETFSYTLSESLAAGIPVIVTDLGALKERVEQDKVGWVVNYKKSEEICTLLHRLQADRSEVATFKQNISNMTLEDLEMMKESYTKLYARYLSPELVKPHERSAVLLSKQKLIGHSIDGAKSKIGRASWLKFSYLLHLLKHKLFDNFFRKMT